MTVLPRLAFVCGWLIVSAVVAAGGALAADPKPSSDAARAAFAAAAALQNREAWDLAAEEWQALIAAHPQDPLAIDGRYYLGVCQLKREQWADAAKSLRDFLAAAPQQHPQAAEATHFLGEALWQANDRKGAIASWERFVRDHARSPRLPDVLYALGVGQAQAGQPQAAAATLERFVKEFPDHRLAPDVAIWRADLAAAAGQPAAAEQILAPFVAATAPRAAEALDRLGTARWNQKNWAGAADAFGRLLKEHPDSPLAARAAVTAGRALVEAGRTDEARTALRQAAARPGPEAVEAGHRLALLELAAKRPEAALEAATAALSAATRAGVDAELVPRLELDRADALWELPGKRAEAAAAYAALAQKHPAAPAAATALAMTAAALLEEKKPAEALAAADRFLAAHGRTAAADTLLDVESIRAEALLATGKARDAAAAFRRLLAAHPAADRAPAWMLLAVESLRAGGESQAALQLAEQLVAAHPRGPHADAAWYRLGQLRQEAGKHADAIAAYEKSLATSARGPRAPWALLATGWCQEAQKRLPDAIRAWTAVIDTFPDSPAATQALLARGDARQRSGDHAGGLADAQRLLKAAREKQVVLEPATAAEARLLEGLCLAGEKKYAQAAAAFRALGAEQPQFAPDRVLFELGTALTLDGKAADAAAAFAALAEKHPKSRFAADAWLEVGEGRWAAEQWDDAATAYSRALDAAAGAGGRAAVVREQAAHKLGWTQVMRKDHAAAVKAFTAQLAAAPQGGFAADAQAMLGGSLLALDRFAEADRAFAQALADPQRLSSAGLRDATFIRASEAAARQMKWQESLAFAERFLAAAPDSPQAPQGRYAAAWARQNLGRLDEALAGYRAIADGPRTELAARSRLMEGEVLFEQGRHKDAIKAFFKAAYGFGETKAPREFHAWQAQATYEAARCFEVLAQPEQARRLYAELVERYPDSEHVPAARKRLEALGPAPAPAGGNRS